MILPENDAEFFLDVYNSLLYYSYSEFEDINVKEFFESGIEKRLIGRKNIFNNVNIIDEYIEDCKKLNGNTLSTYELDLLKQIKNGKYKNYIVVKKNNEVYYFDYDNNIYKITGIKEDPIDLYVYFPCLIKTAILNFGNNIISDGLIEVMKIKYDLNASKLILRDFDKIYLENMVHNLI